ncbi:MAG: hypothetical protein ACRDIY_07990, partial [Chloroflexota bacterium]
RDVVADGEEGLLVPPGDVVALSEALGRVVGDAQLGRDLGRRGQLKAPRFAWPTVVTQVLNTYYGAIAHMQESADSRRGSRVTRPGPVDPSALAGRSSLWERGG